MKGYGINPNSKLPANYMKWLTIILIVIAGAYYFELVKQYFLFIALAIVGFLLVRR